MKLTVVIFLVLIIYLYLGNTEIGFSPKFYIRIHKWWIPTGWLIISIGVQLLLWGTQRETTKEVTDKIEQINEERINNNIKD